MGELVKDIIKKLHENNSIDELERCLWIAGDLISKVTIQNFKSGFDFIDKEIVTQEESKELQNLLINLLDQNDDLKICSSIIWVLGKSRKSEYKDLYLDVLKKSVKELKENNGMIYQCLIALDDIGETVFEIDKQDSSSQSLIDIEKNLRQAEKYLQQYYINLSW